MNSLPEGYIKGVDRVSNIVSFMFPFDDGYYIKWLELKGIDKDEYLKEAQDVGTFVHLQIENTTIGKEVQRNEPLFILHSTEINHGIDFVSKLEGTLIPEQVVIDKRERYQGTIDLVRIDEENKKVWLYDWKTWGIAKKAFADKEGNPLSNTYKKPYDKIKKVSLQLSLYAEYYRCKGYTIEGLSVIWLHETGCYEYKLDMYSTRDINKILRKYQKFKELKIEINHIGDMIIELRKPTEQYGYINITIDLYKDESGKTKEELIEEGIDVINYIVNNKNEK